MPTDASRTATIRGVPINYEVDESADAGDRPTLVLVHGFAASLRTWDPIAPALTRTHRLLRHDLKGFGRSGRPRGGPYTIAENAAILVELIARERPGRIVLVGHSYGGAVACLAAGMLRAIVDGLVLIDSASYDQKLPFFISGLRLPVLRWLSPWMGTAAMRSRVVLNSLFVDRSLIDAAIVERYAFPLRRPGGDYGYARTARQILPESFDAVTTTIRSIDVPTQIIWGDRDTAVPFAFARRLHGDIRGSRLAVVPGVGHMPHEERPGEVLRVLGEFLESLPA